MIIDQLPNLSLPAQGTDEIPIERGQLTYKVKVKDIIYNAIRPSDVGVNANGTWDFTVPNMTPAHVVINWGMYWDNAGTDPIPENAPPCDLTITTGNGTWQLTVENFTSSFYLRPTFIEF